MGENKIITRKVMGAEKAIDYLDPKTGQHLVPKYESFCLNYAQFFKPRLAMEAAGYPVDDKTEHAMQAAFRQVMLREDIRLRCKNLIREKSEAMCVGSEWVVMKWMEIVDRCMQAEPVLDKDGVQTGEWKFDPRNASSTLHDMAAYFGMFKNDKQDAKPVNITMNFAAKEREEKVIDHE
jgi:phage terminase small subunit